MNANDQLSHYNCAEHYYQYLCGLNLTDGAKALADKFQCYWFLDIIASYQSQLKNEEFQVWTIERKQGKSSAIVSCTDGNGKSLVIQDILYTDFKANTAILWLEFNFLLLPSEH